SALRPRAPGVPFYSTSTGALLRENELLDADYWWRNVRNPVRFAEACSNLVADNHELFLEIGPHPVLGGNIREVCTSAGAECALAASQKRESSELRQMKIGAGRLFSAGADIDSTRMNRVRGNVIQVPHVPWQRQKLWLESSGCRLDRLGSC